MRSKTYLLFIILPVLTIIYSCAAYRYVTPYKHFSHEKHEMEVVKEGRDCFFCHSIDLSEVDPQVRIEMLRIKLKEADDKRFISGRCHLCHVDQATRIPEAPSACPVCHDNMQQVKPGNHQGLWISTHARQAGTSGNSGVYKAGQQASPYSCDSCHDQWYCVNCHTSRDIGKSRMHTRTFKVAHVAAAVSDPAFCSSCHTAQYCRDCHSR